MEKLTEKKNIDVQTLHIALIEEGKSKFFDWINFEVNGAFYQIRIYLFERAGNLYRIAGIFHLHKECSFCKEKTKEMDFCTILFSYKLLIFDILRKQSKYRLQWVLRNMS